MKEVSVINFKGTAGKRQIKDKISRDAISIEKTVSGNPITISDALPVPAKSLKTTLSPIQDLHGYDKPWVGGAGKNKLPMTVESIKAANTSGAWTGNNYVISGVTFSILTDSANNVTGIALNNTATSGNAVFYLTSYGKWLNTATNYILNGITGGSGSTYKLDVTTAQSPIVTATDGDTSAFTVDNSADYRARIVVYENTNVSGKSIYPMVRVSTESATFAPYSNICPISGRTEVAVDDEGKNQWNYGIATGYGSNSFENAHKVHGNPITIHVKRSSGTGQINYKVYNPDGTTAYSDAALITANNTEANLTIPNNIDGLYLVLYGINGATSEVITELQVAAESSYSSYEPYKGITATIQLGTTVYGAEVDFNEGTAEVTDGYIASYDGETLPSTWISDRDVYAAGTTPTTGAEVVYKLANPTTLQLTPSQLQMLKGYNRVTMDNGSISLTYWADRIQALETALAQLLANS